RAAMARAPARAAPPAATTPGPSSPNSRRSSSSFRRSSTSWRPEPRSAARLFEAQRHAVALADRQVAFAVDIPQAQRRRQRPDALRPVMGVARIGVDLGGGDEAKARLLREPADGRDLHVAAAALARGIGVLGQAVLDDAERAAGLQHPKHLAEGFGAVVL